MAIHAYSYRIGKNVALLGESEWQQIEPLLLQRIEGIKKYRQETGASISHAVLREPIGQRALAEYERLFGIRLDHPDQLWGVRMENMVHYVLNVPNRSEHQRQSYAQNAGFNSRAANAPGLFQRIDPITSKSTKDSRPSIQM